MQERPSMTEPASKPHPWKEYRAALVLEDVTLLIRSSPYAAKTSRFRPYLGLSRSLTMVSKWTSAVETFAGCWFAGSSGMFLILQEGCAPPIQPLNPSSLFVTRVIVQHPHKEICPGTLQSPSGQCFVCGL